MEDYVNQAQQVMSRIAKDGLTTSQLRLFLSAVNAVNGKVEQYKNRMEGLLRRSFPQSLPCR